LLLHANFETKIAVLDGTFFRQAVFLQGTFYKKAGGMLSGELIQCHISKLILATAIFIF